MSPEWTRQTNHVFCKVITSPPNSSLPHRDLVAAPGTPTRIPQTAPRTPNPPIKRAEEVEVGGSGRPRSLMSVTRSSEVKSSIHESLSAQLLRLFQKFRRPPTRWATEGKHLMRLDLKVVVTISIAWVSSYFSKIHCFPSNVHGRVCQRCIIERI